MPEFQPVQVVQLVRYSITVPGIPGGAFFVELPAGSPAPRVVVSETVARENQVTPLPMRLGKHGATSCTVFVGGQAREVAPTAYRVLREIVQGAELVTFRPETQARLERDLPEVMAGLTRDTDRKVINKMRAWRVADWLRKAAGNQVKTPVHNTAEEWQSG